MNFELANLVNQLGSQVLSNSSVIEWGAPVPAFGDLSISKIATVGLNPSNREFVDSKGIELSGDERRFHTLSSLGISNWSKIDTNHLELMLSLCKEYFVRNPYDAWFKKLDYIISGTSISYYFPSYEACHLDLIPYATTCKWTDLTTSQRSFLLKVSGDTLGQLIRTSPIQLLILNGETVVQNFENMAQTKLNKTKMSNWDLPRKSGVSVPGYSYQGIVRTVGRVDLGRDVAILGYNHNIQSSFGVTSNVLLEIRTWISQLATHLLT